MIRRNRIETMTPAPAIHSARPPGDRSASLRCRRRQLDSETSRAATLTTMPAALTAATATLTPDPVVSAMIEPGEQAIDSPRKALVSSMNDQAPGAASTPNHCSARSRRLRAFGVTGAGVTGPGAGGGDGTGEGVIGGGRSRWSGGRTA